MAADGGLTGMAAQLAEALTDTLDMGDEDLHGMGAVA